MDSKSYCDPCSGEGKSLASIRFCLECEEHLCTDCVEYHKKLRALKLHHLIDVTSILQSKIPMSKKFCGDHPGITVDFWCTEHDVALCRACIPSNHQSCEGVLLLEDASKNIKNSSLYEDTLSEWQNIGKTLRLLEKDRKGNIDELEKAESSILIEISKCKTNFINRINTLEDKLKEDISNAKQKHINQVRKDTHEISKLNDVVEGKKQELEFLKEHGSNNQLYLTLREQIGVQTFVERVKDMTLSYKKVVLEFKKANAFNIRSIGSILETKEKCGVRHTLIKYQQAQFQLKELKTLLAPCSGGSAKSKPYKLIKGKDKTPNNEPVKNIEPAAFKKGCKDANQV